MVIQTKLFYTMRRNIITIGGMPGSGKSSTGKILAKNLGLRTFSMGDVQRQYAENLGMDFTEYSEMQKTDHAIDTKVDEYQTELGHKEDRFILDSRLGWFFIPESFKVFLTLPTIIAAERIVADAKNNPTRKVEEIESVEDAIQKIQHRVESERERYKKLYDIDDHFDPSHYDLVVDTSKHNQEEVVAIIQEAYEVWRTQA